MAAVLEGLEPPAFWRHLAALAAVPRPSRGEERVADHVRRWAAERGLESEADAAGNLVVRVPASPGRESAPALVLQGHLDMVCEREPGSELDPARDGVRLRRDGDWLRADGTTLGADNGAGIAAMLALADETSAPHGPLELLMTVAEEVGLEGANALDGTLVGGSLLLNLDGEDDGQLTVGGAGSADSWIRLDAPREPVGAGETTLGVRVTGGRGGHSGGDIATGRANALKVLGHVLRVSAASTGVRLVSFDGGRSRNAIPRAAVSVVAVADEPAFRAALERAGAAEAAAHRATDPGVRVVVEPAQAAADAWSEASTAELLDVVAVVPTGALALDPRFPGVVETSTSLSVATTEGSQLELHSLTRTSNDDALGDVLGTLEAASRLAGGSFEVKHNYPAWTPDLDAPLLRTVQDVYVHLFGAEPAVTVVHGGLEPAVIAGRVGRPLEMLSVGPRIEGAHSPDERLHIGSVGRFWRLLLASVDELSRPAVS